MAHGLVGSGQIPEVRRPPWQGLLRSTFLRFLVVGGVSYVVNQTLLFALYEGGLRRLASLGGLNTGLLLASVLALEASVLVRFAMNDRWTFGAHHAKPFRQRLAQSNLSAAGGTAIALAGVNLLTPLLGINYLLANSIGIAFGLAWNWIWSTRVVWRPVAIGK